MRTSGTSWLVSIIIAASLLLVAVSGSGAVGSSATPQHGDLERVDRSERVLMRVSELLETLEQALREGEVPGPARALFASRVEVVDLSRSSSLVPSELPSYLGVERQRIRPQAEPLLVRRDELRLFAALLRELSEIDLARWVALDGDFLGDSLDRFRSRHQLQARGWRGKRRVALEGEVELDWRRDAGAWRVVAWRSGPVMMTSVGSPLFEDALDSLITDEGDLLRARRSLHQELIVAYLDDPQGFLPPHPDFGGPSHDRHPAVSVVDIDQDGWDDLYVMGRWGRNLLFRNLGFGRFEEVAEELGLDIESHTSCAVFVDFDNDGDLDAFLGRTLKRSLLLLNEGGRFVDRSSVMGALLPPYVASAAAADYDGDGLIDLYVSTYARVMTANMPLERVITVIPKGLRPTSEELAEMKKSERPFLDVRGPANMLLHNLGGGRFEETTQQTGTAAWRHTSQATWSDYDLDGDADLYLANDYAPNQLFRNRGDGSFEDVTVETGTADQGFGRGVAWSDYDNDGWLDLYVSKVLSQAGRRIVGKIPGADSAFAKMAQGSRLFRNRGGQRFEVVSGAAPPRLRVEETGWSWGSQFLDVDNDGFDDLVVLNGFYTVPSSVRHYPVDLASVFWRAGLRLGPILGTPADSALSDLLGEVHALESRLPAGSELQDGAALGGREPNSLFLNQEGRQFADVSMVSGLDSEADGRVVAVWDYDRDGWPDLAVANANAPRLQVFRNLIGDGPARSSNRFLALRLVGGQDGSGREARWSNRDGVGARVLVEAEGLQKTIEMRRGEGFAAQNSATRLVGLGERESVTAIRVFWPSGRETQLGGFRAGALVTVYEDSDQSPNGQSQVVELYARRRRAPTSPKSR